MNKSLFTESHAYTSEANDLGKKTMAVILPIFDECVAEGFSPREIFYIMSSEIKDRELMTLAWMGF